MVKVRFLGGVYEVGRSSFFIGGQNAGVLLDCGVAVNHETKFPMYIDPKLFSHIVLSHCHLDHIGATPVFFMRDAKKVVGTALTRELGGILELDFLKVTRGYLPFEVLEVRRMLDSYQDTAPRTDTEVGKDVSYSLLDSGHTPGGSQIYLSVEGKSILYTGDINLRPTRLLPGADISYARGVDSIIIEATYASVEHPSRNKVEEEFVAKCREVVEGGGTVLVPAFGVGRSQEMLCVLKAHNFPHAVYVDGMATKVSQILSRYKQSLANPDLFENAISSAEWMTNDGARRAAAQGPGVIVTPAGMLKGGPAGFYSRVVAKDRKNAILLVSYQVEGTPGRLLQQKRVLPLGGETVKVKAKVESYDFSSHCGTDEYLRILENASPKRAFIVHGSRENCDFLAGKCRELGVEGITPELGKEYIV